MLLELKPITFVYNNFHPDYDHTKVWCHWDCDGSVPVFRKGRASIIYLTNSNQFYHELSSYNSICRLFDVIQHQGYLYTSYTYLEGSLR